MKLNAQFTPPERIVLEGDSGVFFNRNSETVLIAKHLHRLELIQANFELNRALNEAKQAYEAMKTANDLLRQSQAQDKSAIDLLRKERDHFQSEAESENLARVRCESRGKTALWIAGGGGVIAGLITGLFLSK